MYGQGITRTAWLRRAAFDALGEDNCRYVMADRGSSGNAVSTGQYLETPKNQGGSDG
jgi:hypothetical protein